MKKMKSCLMLALIAFLTFSCNTEELEINESTSEIEILEFDSKEAMEQEIDRVLELRKQKEALIIEKMFGGDGIPTLTDKMIKESDGEVIDEKQLIESANYYHTEKLKVIYEEREERNFTSIQSIVDELNSLKLLNQTKYNALYNQYADLLIKSEYEISTKFDKGTSNLINAEGFLVLESHKINFNTKEYQKPQNIAKGTREGVITTGYNNFIAITFSKSFSAILAYDLNGNRGVDLAARVGVYCLINSPQGYVNYPCFFNLDARSSYGLNNNGCAVRPGGSIPSGAGFQVTAQSQVRAWGCTDYLGTVFIRVGGEFKVPIAGTSNFLTVSKGIANY
ncbi:hypothetical protein [uncultured Aquimarina sp.]|uniref:hypothetical protein n=1 Tax=uncultured Aquimarina sp. TaxID=575652 RepID=UPI0026018D94|nr:hypothetical protein [uncultured Aquimarina sp.]